MTDNSSIRRRYSVPAFRSSSANCFTAVSGEDESSELESSKSSGGDVVVVVVVERSADPSVQVLAGVESD